jgi:hypothetical protein
MNVNQAPRPGMPRVKKLARLGPVGVLSSLCTTTSERIWLFPRTHRFFVPSSGSGRSWRDRSSADFINSIAGSSFQQAHVAFLVHHRPWRLVDRHMVGLPSTPLAVVEGKMIRAADRQ